MLTISTYTDQLQALSLVKVDGRVDSETAPQLQEALTGLLDAGCAKIVINLKDVEFISSAGLRALVAAYQAAQKAGGSVRLAAVPEFITSIMYTVGLNQMLQSYPSDQEAVADF